jgi:glycosyltransferase involved in cell wall biosynthesis
MNIPPILTIVIPTRNRRVLLSKTLTRLIPQCLKHENEVELIICDNASEDDTKNWLTENFKDKNIQNIELHFFDDFVDIDASFLRSSRLAKGCFLCVFGDDDYPLPGFIDTLLDTIKTNPDLDLIHIQRLSADANMENPRLYQSNMGLEDKFMSIREFVQIFHTSPGFITSLICRTEFWRNDSDFSQFDGYSFLARVYSQVLSKTDIQAVEPTCIYLASPLIVMRKSQVVWKSDWPVYHLVSRQRLLAWLKSEYNLSTKTNPSKFKELVYILLLARATKYPANEPFWNNALPYLSFSQKIVCQLIRYLFPKFLAVFILSRK